MYKVFINNEVVTIEENNWKFFCKNYKIVEAAGGLVLNQKRELLMIYRHEKWDLPKGKIENGERPNEAALREVCEETGVCNCTIIKEAPITFHTYTYKEKNILKKTFWFEMECKSFSGFKLQDEEGIESAEWINRKKIDFALKNTYASINELIEGYLLKSGMR